MCDKCDGKIMLLVGEIKGIVNGIKDKQTEMHKTVTDNRIAAQQEMKDLSGNITKLKVKVIGAGTVFGAFAGFMARFFPS